MNYRSLKITNFRAINSLEADDFKRVNLITGKNNCGKTTFLEALFLISGMSNPQLPIVINNFRDLILNGDDNFSFLFNKLDFSRVPEISAGINSHIRTITIKPRYGYDIASNLITDDKKLLITESGKSIITTSKEVSINGLIVEFSDSNVKGAFKNEISLRENKLSTPSGYKETLVCVFYNTQFGLVQLDRKIELLLVNKQLGNIITILQEIDTRISDLRLGANGMIYADVGYDKLVPINIMGDGIRRILSIIANISGCQNGILLIDEIENGFHYSSLEILWRAILKTAALYNVQLFITTHSQECIAALSSVYSKNQDDNIRLYRIEKSENSHSVFKYSPEMIATGMESNYEVR
ncbi:MAG: AAA family ATPase [Treponema sp.]|jgi:AAA15 family ATPase/GTPase|nr:AAA family ATPase [Treponema sp.]